MKTLVSFCIFLVSITSMKAYVQIVGSGAISDQVNLHGTYIQDFDSLLNTGSGVYPLTLPGWHGPDYAVYTPSGGITGALSSYGSAGSNDRALGGGVWTVSFLNQTSSVINGFSLSYEGEQWHRGSNNPQIIDRMYFAYRIYSSATTLEYELANQSGSDGWTYVDALYFDSPNASLTTSATLDGNASGNHLTIAASVVGISLAPGEKLWFKWVSLDGGFNDHSLAIDNVQASFTAIPEPAISVLLTSLCGLLLVGRRNRQRGQA